MMVEHNHRPAWGPLCWLLVTLFAGLLALLLPAQKLGRETWQLASAVGFAGAGLMSIGGYLTNLYAVRQDRQPAFMRLIFGGMLFRLVVAGIASGLVISMRLLHDVGFVMGLVAGVMVFLAIEIAGLLRWARRCAPGGLDAG